jgi:hypothetical protein
MAETKKETSEVVELETEINADTEALKAENEALKKINLSLEAQLKAKAETASEPKVIKVGKKKYRFAFEAKRKGVLLTEELIRQDEKLAAELVAEGSGVLVEVA